ncbi:MAG: hypothetical protein QM774_04470 [Gordonia sp. (in: high G+C Gram-positive bacteria)]|uniref:hypothetical protein n=1 Tax=Gordonia sp. (in: high G+C Gram-positive bacteria) TaxID=84139 RepID=UPI0039E3FA41
MNPRKIRRLLGTLVAASGLTLAAVAGGSALADTTESPAASDVPAASTPAADPSNDSTPSASSPPESNPAQSSQPSTPASTSRPGSGSTFPTTIPPATGPSHLLVQGLNVTNGDVVDGVQFRTYGGKSFDGSTTVDVPYPAGPCQLEVTGMPRGYVLAGPAAQDCAVRVHETTVVDIQVRPVTDDHGTPVPVHQGRVPIKSIPSGRIS